MHQELDSNDYLQQDEEDEAKNCADHAHLEINVHQQGRQVEQGAHLDRDTDWVEDEAEEHTPFHQAVDGQIGESNRETVVETAKHEYRVETSRED